MRLRILFCVFYAMSTALAASAYVEQVHSKITMRAFKRANQSSQFLIRLGVSENQQFGDRTRFGAATPENLARKGSEDQDRQQFGASPLNHFYDAQAGIALTMPPGRCITVGTRAPEWALGNGFANDYDLPHAKRYLSEAILGPNPGTRDMSFRRFFESLGHLVHLVQDMAQPEHTRNDQHFPHEVSSNLRDWFSALGINDDPVGSYYETWTDTWLGSDDARLPDGGDAEPYFAGYPTVRLADYRSYFHTADRKGMADFASRNFVTQDTNYHDELDPTRCVLHALPQLPSEYREERVGERLVNPLDGLPYTDYVTEKIYTSRPHDAYLGVEEMDPYHTILSSIDLEARRRGLVVFSLADSSYQTRAAMLIPRAVGYSAGFLEHFFRGKIDAKWTQTGTGPIFGYDLTITNRSAETIQSDAKISAVYVASPSYFGRTNSDDTGMIFNEAEIAQFVPGFSGLAPGQSVTFNVPQVYGLHSGDSMLQYERRMAITGTLGAEQDAIIGLVQQPTNLKVRARWTPGASLVIPTEARDRDGRLVAYGNFYSDGRTFTSGTIVSVDTTNSSAIVTFLREPADGYIAGYVIHHCCDYSPATVTLEILRGTDVVRTTTWTITSGSGVGWFYLLSELQTSVAADAEGR